MSLKFRRGKDVKSVADIVLVSTAQSAAPAYLGILPMRDDPALGVEVRFVFPNSPAAKAGLQAGDRIVKVGGPMGPSAPFTGIKRGRSQLADWLANQPAGADIRLEVKRKGGKTDTLAVVLDRMPGTLAAHDDTVPPELPQPASIKKGLAPLEMLKGKPAKVVEQNPPKAQTGTFKRNTADGQHTYWVYVPRNYDPNIAYAMLVWLHPPGKSAEDDVDDFIDLWLDFCRDNHMILLMPLTTHDSGWIPSDATFVAEAMNAIAKEFAIDRQRIVTHGMGVGGQMAIYLGFTERDLVRGVATTGAVVTQVIGGPRDKRLSFYLSGGAVDPVIKSITESRIKLNAKNYPVIFREIPNRGREYLEEPQLREVVRWIDMLDRL